jgi:competence protein ComEA
VATKEENHPCINLNTASIDELETLPGIGRVIAERIVAYRTQFGPFRRPEHLMMVRGISDRKFREIQMLVSVE